MKLTKCENNHFYDADKFRLCPHCTHTPKEEHTSDLYGKTQDNVDTQVPDKQALLQYKMSNSQNTVGWLVCIEGPMRGESYPLYEGINHIGRESHMDVALYQSREILPEDHALITYEAENYRFTLTPTFLQYANVLLNGVIIVDSNPLKNYDTILLGDCTLQFIAFCNEQYHW
jgi:hypothetical protein